jgi:hypothetical protein
MHDRDLLGVIGALLLALGFAMLAWYTVVPVQADPVRYPGMSPAQVRAGRQRVGAATAGIGALMIVIGGLLPGRPGEPAGLVPTIWFYLRVTAIVAIASILFPFRRWLPGHFGEAEADEPE